MTSRGLIIGIALLLAIAATSAVALYVRGVEDRSEKATNTVQVIVSKEDIIAGERLDELLNRGAFKTESVSEDSLVEGAVTSLDQLEGKTTSSPIVAGEQVTVARLEGSGQLPGGTLGIPAGHVGVDVAVSAPAAIFGDLKSGDHVSIYGNFGESAQVSTEVGDSDGDKLSIDGKLAMTVNMVPDALVLKVLGDVPGSSGSLGSTTNLDEAQLAVTLALKPDDAQKIIFADEHGEIHLALIPPGEKTQEQRPLTLTQVIGR